MRRVSGSTSDFTASFDWAALLFAAFRTLPGFDTLFQFELILDEATHFLQFRDAHASGRIEMVGLLRERSDRIGLR